MLYNVAPFCSYLVRTSRCFNSNDWNTSAWTICSISTYTMYTSFTAPVHCLTPSVILSFWAHRFQTNFAAMLHDRSTELHWNCFGKQFGEFVVAIPKNMVSLNEHDIIEIAKSYKTIRVIFAPRIVSAACDELTSRAHNAMQRFSYNEDAWQDIRMPNQWNAIKSTRGNWNTQGGTWARRHLIAALRSKQTR